MEDSRKELISRIKKIIQEINSERALHSAMTNIKADFKVSISLSDAKLIIAELEKESKKDDSGFVTWTTDSTGCP